MTDHMSGWRQNRKAIRGDKKQEFAFFQNEYAKKRIVCQCWRNLTSYEKVGKKLKTPIAGTLIFRYQ